MAFQGFASGFHGQQIETPRGRGKFAENGREYQLWHAGQYLFPSDEAELDRLDAMHKFFLVARKNHLWSPHIKLLEQPVPNLRVLDLGCGTGIWALDVAREVWKRTKDGLVRGVDLSLEMQSKTIFANNKFSAMDIEEQWLPEIGENSQHLIHMRMLGGSVHDWVGVYCQIFKHLVPGQGYLEHVEIDWEAENDGGPPSQKFKKWTTDWLNALENQGRPTRINAHMTRERLRNVGFVDIKEELIRVYVNGGSLDPYESDVGRWFNLCIFKGFMALSLAPLCRGKDPSTVEALKKFEPELFEEIAHRDNRTFVKLYIWTARRP